MGAIFVRCSPSSFLLPSSCVDHLSNLGTYFTDLALDNNTQIILIMFSRFLKKIAWKFNNVKCNCMHAFWLERNPSGNDTSCSPPSWFFTRQRVDRDKLDSIFDVIVFEALRFCLNTRWRFGKKIRSSVRVNKWTEGSNGENSPFSKISGYV